MIGIGGIGMSALAQLFAARGARVTGSDREQGPVTKLLEKNGMSVLVPQRAENVPTDATLVVYSDAVPEHNPERARARELGIRQISYFEALGEATKDRFTIAVAGSHGKTTTTAMLGKILHDAGVQPTVVVGSLIKDFKSNFLSGSGDGLYVVEACEYQDHILKLSPNILVVTNLEWDHTDYFKSFDQLKETFKKAVEKLPKDGALVLNVETVIGKELAMHATCRVVHYADVDVPELSLLGEFNTMNARAAKAAALVYDSSLQLESIDDSLSRFQGSWRRFEYKGVLQGGAEVYDDYAHHPTEVRTTLEAVREKFPDKKIVAAFHPHLFSRTRDLMDDFSRAFGAADEVLIAPIYAAREAPIEGITAEALAARIAEHGTSVHAVNSLDTLATELKAHDSPGTLIITMGAGDIYQVADALTAAQYP